MKDRAHCKIDGSLTDLIVTLAPYIKVYPKIHLIMSQDDEFKEDEEDIETLRYKDLQEIQQKGINRKDYHDIVTDLRQFITDLGQSRDLDDYRKEIEQLFRTLETTYSKVQSDFQLCETRNKEIYEKTMKVRQIHKQSQEDNQRLQVLKNSFEQASKDLDQFRDSEAKTREQIDLLNKDIKEIMDQLMRGEGTMIPEAKDLENLQTEYGEFEKEKKKNEDRLYALNETIKGLNKQIEDIQKQTDSINEMIDNKNKEIERCNATHVAGEEKHRTMSALLQTKRDEVEKLKHEIEENTAKLQSAMTRESLEKEIVDKLTLDLAKSKENESAYDKSITHTITQQKKEEDRKYKREHELIKQKEELAKLREEKKQLENESDHLLQDIQNLHQVLLLF